MIRSLRVGFIIYSTFDWWIMLAQELATTFIECINATCLSIWIVNFFVPNVGHEPTALRLRVSCKLSA